MNYHDLIIVFTSIIYEALPFVVAGVVLAGLLEEFVPQQAIAGIIPSNRVLAIGLGALLGAVFPMCECGIIVVMRRLLRKGLPLSVCVSYMLAGPIINVIVLWSTYVAFSRYDLLGGPVYIVLLRAGLAFLIACTTGLLVERQYRRYGNDLLHPMVTRGLQQPDENNNNSGPRTWLTRLDSITGTALHDFVDIMVFLILGSLLATAGRVVLREGESAQNAAAPAAQVQTKDGDAKKGAEPPRESRLVSAIKSSPTLAIGLMMLIAVLFCLCSEADAFVAANFQLFWPPASKLAFLVLGPMLDIKLYLMYTRVFRPRLIFTIMLAVVVQVFVYAMIVHYTLG